MPSEPEAKPRGPYHPGLFFPKNPILDTLPFATVCFPSLTPSSYWVWVSLDCPSHWLQSTGTAWDDSEPGGPISPV